MLSGTTPGEIVTPEQPGMRAKQPQPASHAGLEPRGAFGGRLTQLDRPAADQQIYLGTFHTHTALSDGAGTPQEVFNRAKTGTNIDGPAKAGTYDLYCH